MKFVRKMDEMERDIVSKSEKTALIFAKSCLAAWCVYIIATQGVQKVVSSWPFMLLLTTVIIQSSSMHILNWRMNKGNSDEK